MKFGLMHLGRFRWLLFTPVVLAAVALSGRARADDDPEEGPPPEAPDVEGIDLESMGEGIDVTDKTWEPIEKKVRYALGTGDVVTVLRATGSREEFLGMVLRTKTALMVHRETVRNLRALRNKSAKLTEFLAKRNDSAALLLDKAKGKTPEMEAAAAFGHLSFQLSKVLGGDRPVLDVLKASVDALKKNEPTVPVTGAEWREILLPSLSLGATLGDDLLAKWASDEIANVTKGKGDDPEVKRMLLLVDLENGVRLIATKPGEAAPLLTRALTALGAKDAFPSSDETLVSHYNAAVTAARLAKISVKADYRVKSVSSQHFTCEIPLSLGWSPAEGNGDVEMVVERAGGPGHGAVHLIIQVYETDMNYMTDDGKQLDGDSQSGMLKYHMKKAHSTATKVTRELPNAGKLSNGVTTKASWELFGQDNEGKSLRVREWGLKVGSAADRWYIARVEETDTSDKDPEVARVLESLAEKAGPKK